MVLRVDILIYIYIALCACTYFYDFVYARRRDHSAAYYERKRRQCKKYILETFEKDSTSAKQKLIRKMRRISFITIFHDIVMERLKRDETKGQMQEWIWDHRDIFIEIRDTYVEKKKSNRRAFYAYMVWQYRLCGESETDTFARTMQYLVMDPSIYCRENALCALYTSGNAKHVAKAYLIMVKNDIHHSPKLVTDGLLTFQGSHKEMGETIWEEYEAFTPDYQVAFINYIRMATEGFEERFMALLEDDTTDLEVRLAIIRYFRSHPYEEAVLFMRNAVQFWKDYNWEISAQAALVLEKDKEMRTVKALMEGCRSVNWYVRKNAAESLLQITDETLAKMIITDEKDKYAKEMLQYILKKNRQGVQR